MSPTPIIISMVIGGFLGVLVGKPKGRSMEGLMLGIFFSLIGVFVTACLSPSPGLRGEPMPQRLGSWAKDPFGRFEYRWFDGQVWTDRVSTAGVAQLDPHGVKYTL